MLNTLLLTKYFCVSRVSYQHRMITCPLGVLKPSYKCIHNILQYAQRYAGATGDGALSLTATEWAARPWRRLYYLNYHSFWSTALSLMISTVLQSLSHPWLTKPNKSSIYQTSRSSSACIALEWTSLSVCLSLFCPSLFCRSHNTLINKM